MSTTSRPSQVVESGQSGPEGEPQTGEPDLRVRAAILQARIVELRAHDGTITQRGSTRVPLPRTDDNEVASTSTGRLCTSDGLDGVSGRTVPRAAWEGVAVSAEQDNLAGRTVRRVAPSWLVSAVVHCLFLVVLAVLTFEARDFYPSLIITSGRGEPETMPELASPLLIEPPPNELAELSPAKSDLDLGLPEPSTTDLAGFSGPTMFGDPLGAAAVVDGAGGSSLMDGDVGAQFFGVQAGGSKFVFIVDSSTSMRLKFADALRELEYSLRGLTPSQRFYVIFFDRNAERMTLGKWNKRHSRYSMKLRPEPDMVPATEENIEGCVRWMHLIQLEQWTNPHSAMEFALDELRPDAIFLLSDGEFTDRGLTEQFLQEKNLVSGPLADPRPKVIIHCIGFYSREGEVTLQRIADTYGGTYRFVEPPPGYVPLLPRFPGRGFGIR